MWVARRPALAILAVALAAGCGSSGGAGLPKPDASPDVATIVDALPPPPGLDASGAEASRERPEDLPSEQALSPPDAPANPPPEAGSAEAALMPVDVPGDPIVSCDFQPIMILLAQKLGRPACYPTASSTPEGSIDFDGEGRVYGITIGDVGTPETQAWADSLADRRWPCMAGQTLGYGCAI